MDDATLVALKSYFLQQTDLDIPDYIFTRSLNQQPYKKENEVTHANETTKKNVPSSVKKDSKSKTSPDEFTQKRVALLELYYANNKCTNCSLHTTRTKLVFGAGSVCAPLLIIGEAPGYEEDKQGKPFVGKAGALLTKMLAAINLDPTKDTFITNILKCRPPENRDPNLNEQQVCLTLLQKQIEIIKPRVILLLGRIAAQALLNMTDPVSTLRFESYRYGTIPVRITYHPAALLRNSSYKRPVWEDLQKLEKLLH